MDDQNNGNKEDNPEKMLEDPFKRRTSQVSRPGNMEVPRPADKMQGGGGPENQTPGGQHKTLYGNGSSYEVCEG